MKLWISEIIQHQKYKKPSVEQPSVARLFVLWTHFDLTAVLGRPDTWSALTLIFESSLFLVENVQDMLSFFFFHIGRCGELMQCEVTA